MNPAKIVIRKATSDDVQTISEITDASYGKWVPLIGRKPLPMMADYGRMAIENEIWLLSVDEQAAGVLVLVYEAESTLIYSVAIKPEYQKKGLGHRLLDLAEECAKRAGHNTVRLYTNERFEENIALYKRYGYRETKRELAVLGSIAVYMDKAI